MTYNPFLYEMRKRLVREGTQTKSATPSQKLPLLVVRCIAAEAFLMEPDSYRLSKRSFLLRKLQHSNLKVYEFRAAFVIFLSF
ncbi:hypothetical protein C1N70_20300 [Cytobacillus firmus]